VTLTWKNWNLAPGGKVLQVASHQTSLVRKIHFNDKSTDSYGSIIQVRTVIHLDGQVARIADQELDSVIHHQGPRQKAMTRKMDLSYVRLSNT